MVGGKKMTKMLMLMLTIMMIMTIKECGCKKSFALNALLYQKGWRFSFTVPESLATWEVVRIQQSRFCEFPAFRNLP
jgi:hypothetical protein